MRQRTCLLTSSRESGLENLKLVLGRDYAITEVTNDWEARQVIDEKIFDLMIHDPNLQGGGGLRLLRPIKERFGDACPIIIYSDSRDEALRIAVDEALQAKAIDAALPWPCPDATFLNAIWDAADRQIERSWNKLPAMPSKLLKVARANINRIERAVLEGGTLPPNLISDLSESVVDAAADGYIDPVMDQLRAHHGYTFTHTLQVSSLMTIFGIAISLDRSDVVMLAKAGLMHDVGKVEISREILNKPSPLDDREWEIMRRHPLKNAEVLARFDDIPPEVFKAATGHHERMDGAGYPNGLKGAQISDITAICTIADVYSALVDKRSYKPAQPPEKALKQMAEMAGSYLEPGFFNKFRDVVLGSS